ncbi:dienelactone hydrolase family protein [Paenibacillus filicis]|uniref:Dienelactone hydrolase family protein n=1 Tax=Paenibacillus filicis TaxID=669464 RepID=A0ABU9DJN0_9BACL
MNTSYSYDVQLPTEMDSDKTYPAVFTLHGRGSNERNMAGLVAPLEGDFIRIHIRGDLPLGSGYQYYELKSFGNPIRESFDQAVQQLQAIIGQLTEQYPIDPGRRYLLGFSQGAILSMTLALAMGDQLKGIVALNGYVPEFVKTEYSLRDIRDVSVFLSHGEYDSIFPVQIGHETAAYVGGLTPRLTFHTYPTDHSVSEENQRDYLAWLQSDAGLTTPKE